MLRRSILAKGFYCHSNVNAIDHSDPRLDFLPKILNLGCVLPVSVQEPRQHRLQKQNLVDEPRIQIVFCHSPPRAKAINIMTSGQMISVRSFWLSPIRVRPISHSTACSLLKQSACVPRRISKHHRFTSLAGGPEVIHLSCWISCQLRLKRCRVSHTLFELAPAVAALSSSYTALFTASQLVLRRNQYDKHHHRRREE
jgi:hypothetical protein